MATIRLTGQIPPGARHFTWSYAWTFASYAMTVRRAASENPATEWLEGGQTSAPFALTSPAPPVDRLGTAWRYLALGFTHIVPHGLDHMLFVLGIYLLSRRARSVLWQVSAFTVAHSITLGLSMYGVVAVSPRIVEPLIALSIAYVAIENIFLSELKSWRVALVFAFGLLHGMGFAGALKELGLPRSEFVTALLTFNVGVEAGQLAVIGAAFMLVGWHCANRDLVPQPHRRSRVDADRVHGGLLDDRAAVLLETPDHEHHERQELLPRLGHVLIDQDWVSVGIRQHHACGARGILIGRRSRHEAPTLECPLNVAHIVKVRQGAAGSVPPRIERQHVPGVLRPLKEPDGAG